MHKNIRKNVKRKKTKKLFLKAQLRIPSFLGISSDAHNLFVKRASSAFLWDEDHIKYIDYVGGGSSMILGHANPAIVKTLRESTKRGTSFCTPNRLEIKLSELMVKMVPSIEMAQITLSEFESIILAINLAKTYTHKEKTIRFEGCHEIYCKLLNTITVQYNNLDSVRTALQTNHNEVACIIVEPILTKVGCIPPKQGFLEGLRKLCDEFGTLLIFDESVTGFRISPAGAQAFYGVLPDLTILGGIIGGGIPLGACGGKKEIMQTISSLTVLSEKKLLHGNPLAVSAGIKTLKILQANKLIYKKLEDRGKQLEEGIRNVFYKLKLNYALNRIGSMWTIFFTSQPVSDYASAKTADLKKYSVFYNSMLESGIHLPPSQFTTAFISTAHTERIIERSTKKLNEALTMIFRNNV